MCSRIHPVTLSGTGEPERVESALVSANLMQLLRVAPIAGRLISPEEEQRGERVVVLSNRLWQRRFAGSRRAIGSALQIEGRDSVVIGVMPAEFQFPAKDTEFWEPYSVLPNLNQIQSRRFTNFWRVIGRLRPGVQLAAAQADLSLIGQRLAQEYPELAKNPDFPGFAVNIVPLPLQVAGKEIRLALSVLLGAVTLVLFIACTNVAGQVLTESLVLSSLAAKSPLVAVINETMARRFWPDQDPLGKHFRMNDTTSLMIAVVGIVGDTRRKGLEREPISQLFLPVAQSPSRGADLVVKTSGDPLSLATAVRGEIRALDASAPISRLGTLEGWMDEFLSARRFETVLLLLFSAAALVLSACGIFAVLHYFVVQRKREIAIRVALGAQRRAVLRMVLGKALQLVLAGTLVGVAGGIWSAQVLSSVLLWR